MKKLFKIFLLLCLIGIAIVVWCSYIVEKSSRGKLFNNVNDIPCNDVGLLLGTNPIGRTGRPNIYYVHRIRMYFREKLARTKAVLDILFGKKPHFLGEPVPITIPK